VIQLYCLPFGSQPTGIGPVFMSTRYRVMQLYCRPFGSQPTGIGPVFISTSYRVIQLYCHPFGSQTTGIGPIFKSSSYRVIQLYCRPFGSQTTGPGSCIHVLQLQGDPIKFLVPSSLSIALCDPQSYSTGIVTLLLLRMASLAEPEGS
jgi:hypothetical protein